MKKLVLILFVCIGIQSQAQESVAGLLGDQTRLYGFFSGAGGVNIATYGLGVQMAKSAGESNYLHIWDVNLGYAIIGNRFSDENYSYSSQSLAVGSGIGLRTGVVEIKLPVNVYIPIGSPHTYSFTNYFSYTEPLQPNKGPFLNMGLDLGFYLSKKWRLGLLMGFPLNEPIDSEYYNFGVNITGFFAK